MSSEEALLQQVDALDIGWISIGSMISPLVGHWPPLLLVPPPVSPAPDLTPRPFLELPPLGTAEAARPITTVIVKLKRAGKDIAVTISVCSYLWGSVST